MEKLINYFKQLWLKFKAKAVEEVKEIEQVVVEEIKEIPTPTIEIKLESQKERDNKTRKRKYYSNKPANDSRGKSKKGSVATKNA